MPSKLLIFLIGLSITTSLCAEGPIEEYDPNKTYPERSLVLVGQDSYIATQAVPTGTSPPNTTYWADLSFVASELNIPEDKVPTLTTEEILATKPNSQPAGSESNATGTPKIVRMSVRGHIGTGDDERFMRLTVSGNANVMVRAIGPSLGDLASSLANVSLLDPEMFISDSAGSQITANNNDDYTSRSDASQIESISSSLSVVIPIKSSESASIADYITGTYYANVRDKSYSASYGTRIGWVGADITDTSGTAKFTGVSTRGVIKPGDGSMFASFEIVGDSSGTRKIFLRARGASLGTMGVKNVLSNINLKLFKLGGTSSTLITSNNDYTSESNSAEIATKAQSFYGALDATDAGLIVDLAPGYYSIWAESETGSTGVGWVGIDDITE